MKATFALLLTATLAVGIWIAFIVRPLLPSIIPHSSESVELRLDQEDTAAAQWVRGIVRSIDLATSTVLLQTEEGPIELFAPPLVLFRLTEGETVSVYIAADELATTVTI